MAWCRRPRLRRDLVFWVLQPVVASGSEGERMGCIMSLPFSAEVTSSWRVPEVAAWVNEVYLWGLGTRRESCEVRRLATVT